jgi:virulence factor Mce-like protein
MNGSSNSSHGSRERHKHHRNERAAVVAIVALLALTAFVFLIEGDLGRPGYTIRGVFASTSGIQPGSPVRVSGVDVGTVSGVSPGPRNTSVVSMNLGSEGRPVYSDTTMSIIPRLILEGSYYVNLDPGTPGAAQLRNGETIPESQTSVPVQFDQFLDTFTLPVRGALQSTFKGLAEGFGGGGTKAQPTGATGFRAVVSAFDRALPSMSRAAGAAQGTGVGDLHRTIVTFRDLTSQLAESPPALSGSVEHFNRLMGDLAAEDQPLARSIDSLNAVLRTAPPSLAALNRALPEVGRFTRSLDPALRAAPKPLEEGTSLLQQVRMLSSPAELPALLEQMAPINRTDPQLEQRLAPLVKLVTPADKCLSGNVVPTLGEVVPDAALSTGDPAWLDILHALAGVSSVSGGFDGNGAAIRAGTAVGASQLQGVIPGLGAVAGIGPTMQGVSPTWLGYGVVPSYRPDVWCDTQPLPRLGDRSGPAPDWAKHAVAVRSSIEGKSR